MPYTILLFFSVLLTFALPQPRKVVFIGDSITESGVREGGFIDLLRKKLKDDGNADVELIGKGVGGNMVRHLLARIESDVVSLSPDVVVLSVGINDVGFFVWHPETGGTPADQYELGLRYMIKRMQQKGIRVVLCTPTVIEERHNGANPLDPELDKYAGICRRVAKELRVDLCDLRKEFIQYLKKKNPENELKGILTTDYVHLTPAGNALVADVMYPFLTKRSTVR